MDPTVHLKISNRSQGTNFKGLFTTSKCWSEREKRSKNKEQTSKTVFAFSLARCERVLRLQDPGWSNCLLTSRSFVEESFPRYLVICNKVSTVILLHVLHKARQCSRPMKYDREFRGKFFMSRKFKFSPNPVKWPNFRGLN